MGEPQFHRPFWIEDGPFRTWMCLDHENPDDPAGVEMLAMTAPTMPSSAEALFPVLVMIKDHLLAWDGFPEPDPASGFTATKDEQRNELGRIFMVISGKTMRCLDVQSPAVECVRDP